MWTAILISPPKISLGESRPIVKSTAFSVSTFLDGGTNACEDRIGQTKRSLWVIDGATTFTYDNIPETETDAVWFAERVNEMLKTRLDDDESITTIMRNTIKTVRSEFSQRTDTDLSNPLNTPAGTIALVRVIGDEIKYFILGDCTIVLERTDGEVIHLPGGGPRKYDAKAVSELERLMRERKSYEAAKKEIEDMLVEHRKEKNTADGYWTLGLDPEAVSHACTGMHPVNNIDGVYLFTDGYEPIVTLFDVFEDWPAMVEYLKKNGGKRAIRVLRAFEESDPNCRQYPRLSPSDDVALGIARRPMQ